YNIKMNDPTADRIPLFRHDYEQLKRQVLRASEDILLATFCCSHLRFGYIVITSDRLVYVAFGADRPGPFGIMWSKRRVRINGQVPIETRPIPKSNLTGGELKSRQVFEMPLDHLIRVERLQDVPAGTGRQSTRVVRLALRVLRESTFDVDQFPRLLIFWDPLDGTRVYDVLVNAATSHQVWYDQTALAGAGVSELARPFIRRPAVAATLE
ncbi:MAG TPA: hypothetical protein VF478_09275, partial [Anaerolineae bacterium]